MLAPLSIVAPRTSPARSPIVTHGKIIGSRVDLHQAVGHHLAVHDVDPGVNHHRVADRDLGERHRQAVRQARQHRHAERLQACLGPVQRLSQECVALPCQPQALEGEVERSAELVALSAVARGHMGVGRKGLHEAWMSRADRAPDVVGRAVHACFLLHHGRAATYHHIGRAHRTWPGGRVPPIASQTPSPTARPWLGAQARRSPRLLAFAAEATAGRDLFKSRQR